MKHHGIRPTVKFTKPSLTETEHAKFLEPKLILERLQRGLPVSLAQNQPSYGIDDTNQTKLDVVIQRQQLKEYLDALIKKPLTQKELNALKKLAPGYDFTKVKTTPETKNVDKNEPNDKNHETKTGDKTSTKNVAKEEL